MKKLLVAFALAAVSTLASAQVAGSRHDFSTNGMMSPAPSFSCRGCHTAHGAQMADTLIWAVAPFTTTGLTLYSPATTVDPKGVGACMSCHATNAFTGLTGTMTTTALTLILNNDHPVGNAFTVGVAPSFVTGIVLGGVTVAAGTEMTCGTCHSVHNVQTSALAGNLIKSYTAANICVACHNK